MSGRYSYTYNYDGSTRAMLLRRVDGTAGAPITLKAYPGAHPVIAPDTNTSGIYLLQSDYLVFEGLEINRAYQTGLEAAAATNIELRNMWIHDVDGVDNNNIAGLRIAGMEQVEVHHCLIHDNYDRTNADTGGEKTMNSRNIVLFGGGNIRLHHNVIFQTPPTTASKTGACIGYKHSATVAGSHFEVDHNVFWNCSMYSIGSGSFGNRFHHNLIVNSSAITLKDFGGETHNEDTIIEFNTIVGGTGLSYSPTTTYGPIGLLTFRKNIIVDQGSYNQDRGIVTMSTYGSDALYDQVISPSKLSFSTNCYYNAGNTPKWAIFAANGGSYGTKGGLWDLSTWQGMGYDAGSAIINPQLDAYHVPQEGSCQTNGWTAQ